MVTESRLTITSWWLTSPATEGTGANDRKDEKTSSGSSPPASTSGLMRMLRTTRPWTPEYTYKIEAEDVKGFSGSARSRSWRPP